MSDSRAQTVDTAPGRHASPTQDGGDPGLEPGQLVGQRYRLVEPLGEGGMGQVWRARHEELNTDVAIKVALVGERDRDRMLERFRFEAQVSAQLSRHTPHIVAVHDTGHHQGAPYMVMELVEGLSLQAIVDERRTLDVERVADVLEQLADGLDAAHQRGIWHRDIKPANVLVTERTDGSWLIKLADFGVSKALARELDLDEPGTTDAGMLVGSPSYMSPEQLDGRVLDAHSDLWSLAVLAYEALSGSLPFEGKTLGALITAITTKKPIPPSVVATVPPALDDWFAKALAKRGEERFVSAPEMAAAFRAAMQAEPRRWRPLWWAAAAGAIALALVWLTLGTHDVPLRASPLPSLDVALPTAQATSDPSSVRGPDDANRADPAPKATARPQPRALPPPSAPHSASSYDPSDTF